MVGTSVVGPTVIGTATIDRRRTRVRRTDQLDNERVLVLYQRGGRGNASGLGVGQIGSKAANLFHVHDGEVTRLVVYWSPERALAHLGLTPDTGT